MLSKRNSLVTYEPKRQPKICVSCGIELEKRRRRYCSNECKENLIFSLRWLTNLLYALNAKFATFSFTESVIIVNIISYKTKDILTFFYGRTKGSPPSSDLKSLIMELNAEWYHENKRTRCRQLASNYVLDMAYKGIVQYDEIRPNREKKVTKIRKHLTCLKISNQDLNLPGTRKKIKSAFRRAAKEHHPDRGGDNKTFNKIQDAYQEILEWLDNPTFSIRKGVMGKWSYHCDSNKWYPPF